ncbi:putative N-terminal Xaa-Pro-Lys N-methyltransferase 1 [Paratrimastix pyriformis]|uniref:Alpha N-terminal protein methyltransferase 1 n=1 Tax=Paratrimastix pyriformis TaxID=342808 RepID=A0ABQ8UMV6_9EUKA|nr:putative N-terminal Xaa-Pro-Lys N-methyltransferase 1 [Paratrimastix pyriformis]|eukprot:GAFH01004014.1.p1 GENE.GAFH01004014.1~~GAFH01004014.1.p1  ORF type:complete len:248 (+),score=54.05 GAFH01004014.1:18-761(+)
MQELEQTGNEERWYKVTQDYWKEQPSTVDGMLGGIGEVAQTDEEGSRAFIQRIFQRTTIPPDSRALDCGAGIGRVTIKVLADCFQTIDVQEQSSNFVRTFQEACPEELRPRIGMTSVSTLQDFVPTPNTYDCIWIQWVLAYLKPAHLVQCLQRCAAALKPGGFIVVKENVARGTEMLDEQDNYAIRFKQVWLDIFAQAGLEVRAQEAQQGFPRALFPVWFFALQPAGAPQPPAAAAIPATAVAVATS